MRTLAVVVALVMVVLPGAQAWEDPEGDVEYEVQGAGRHPAPVDHPAADLLEVLLGDETQTSFNLSFRVADRGQVSLAEYTPYFSYGGLEHRIAWAGCGGFSNDLALQVFNEGAASFTTVGCVAYDPQWPWVHFQIPKEAVRDVSGLPLGLGGTVGQVRVEARELVAPSPAGAGTTWAVDEAPDEGFFEGGLVMQMGTGGFGDLLFAALAPLRASNGGPDTFLYSVVLENGGQDTVLLLSADNVPARWEIRLPARVALDAGQRVILPVVVVTSAAHAHGDTQTFTLTATTQEGLSGGLELGIHYLDVPQLAGHHSTLHFHSAPYDLPDVVVAATSQRVAWFNTVEEVEGADDQPFGPSDSQTQNGEVVRNWRVPLDPRLLIGMDFEPTQSGELALELITQNYLGDVHLSGRLMHCHADDAAGEAAGRYDCPRGSWFSLASVAPESFAVQPDERIRWEAELEVDGYADLVPYVDGSNIALWVEARHVGAPVGYTGLRFDPAPSWMQLPLNEYKDPIDEAFEDIGSLRIAALGAFDKVANRGQEVWYAFRVENTGEDAQHLRLDAVGQGADWVDWRPDTFRLGPGESRDVHFRVTVPEAAALTQFVEAFAIVESVDDPAVSALAKFRTTLVDQPVEQEAPPAIEVPGKKSPLPAVFVVAVLLVMGRRR